MKTQLEPAEVRLYIAGHVERKGEANASIMNARIERRLGRRKLILELASNGPTGGRIRRTQVIDIRRARWLRCGTFSMLYPRRGDDRPLTLHPHPDKRASVLDYTERYWRETLG